MENQTEYRDFPVEINVESRAEGEPAKIVGHAAVFDTMITLYPGVKERVAKGAFQDSIAKDDVRALFNHDPNYVLGRNKNGTLKLSEDSTGLLYEVDPPDTQQARDVVALIKRGDISQNSFGFRVIDQGWDEEADGTLVRTLNKVKLFDVSPVTYPAYPTTDLKLRSEEDLRKEAAEALKKPGRTLEGFDREAELREKEFEILLDICE
jgi:HK97 family phage prohead protease